jgi:hypothetical protein
LSIVFVNIQACLSIVDVLVNMQACLSIPPVLVNIKLYQSSYSSFPSPIGAIKAVNLSFRGVDDCTSTDETPKSW